MHDGGRDFISPTGTLCFQSRKRGNVSELMYVGADPGASGALALVRKAGDTISFVKSTTMPIVKVGNKSAVDTEKLYDWFPFNDFVATLEEVASMPKQGVASTFQFGRMYGGIEAVLDSSAKEIIYVRPQQWKKYFGISSDKNTAIDAATELFGFREDWNHIGPRGGSMIQENSGRAEAALLAYYGAKNRDRHY